MRPSLLIALSLALHLYIGARLVPQLATPTAVLLAVLLTASAAWVPLGLLARRLARGRRAFRLEAVGFFFLGSFSSFFVLTLLRDVLDRRGEADSPLGRLLEQAAADDEGTLRRLAGRIGALLDARESEPAVEREDRSEGRRIRRRALLGAGATAALALAAFLGLRQYANHQAPQRPEPPRAPPAAMQPARGENASAAAAPAGWRAAPARRVTP